MSCNHDWFDHYMMYSAMSGGNKGGDDWGCLIILLEAAGAFVVMCGIAYVLSGGNI